MHRKHHHHIGAIALVPFALLLIAPQWGRARMVPTIEHYEELAVRAEQEMQLLEGTFESVQRSNSLLEEGEEKTQFPSVIFQHRARTYGSEAERYEMAEIRNAVLRQRIAAMRENFIRSIENRRLIYIDLSNQQATVVDDGEIIAHYPVSSGALDTPTPTGSFQIHRKQKLRVSNLETPYRMPYYMAFTESQSHGLHALPYLGNGPESSAFWHEARTHIGHPVSHGCVRLLPEDAEKLFEWAEVGTAVVIKT